MISGIQPRFRPRPQAALAISRRSWLILRLETADASTTQRLAAIEERLLMLETRQRPPQ
jgi:hypothetical protein